MFPMDTVRTVPPAGKKLHAMRVYALPVQEVSPHQHALQLAPHIGGLQFFSNKI